MEMDSLESVRVARGVSVLRRVASVSQKEVAVVGGYNLSGSLMAQLVEAVLQASVNKVLLPWYTLDVEDLHPFVEY
jgi:hypothetical protein